MSSNTNNPNSKLTPRPFHAPSIPIPTPMNHEFQILSTSANPETNQQPTQSEEEFAQNLSAFARMTLGSNNPPPEP
ncbi:hypothetical protein BB558_006909, partial [Smittium angustum]